MIAKAATNIKSQPNAVSCQYRQMRHSSYYWITRFTGVKLTSNALVADLPPKLSPSPLERSARGTRQPLAEFPRTPYLDNGLQQGPPNTLP